jgi:hypothetical protein
VRSNSTTVYHPRPPQPPPCLMPSTVSARQRPCHAPLRISPWRPMPTSNATCPTTVAIHVGPRHVPLPSRMVSHPSQRTTAVMHPGPTRRTFAKGTAKSAHDDLNLTAKATNLMLNANEDADCSPDFTELPAGGGGVFGKGKWPVITLVTPNPTCNYCTTLR